MNAKLSDEKKRKIMNHSSVKLELYIKTLTGKTLTIFLESSDLV
jgi:hypothetical protein